MRIYGIDFTSSPGTRKPITCAACTLEGDHLVFEALRAAVDFPAFERWLAEAGPWVAGLDFPFAQSRKFITEIGWNQNWFEYVAYVGGLDRPAFVGELERYKAPRKEGDKEHSRSFEKAIGASSPQKLYGVPVAKMFFEGAPRLMRAGVDLPGLLHGDSSRICVEAYPGVLARVMLAANGMNGGYKAEARRKQTNAQAVNRRSILSALTGETGRKYYGLRVTAPESLCGDPAGDELDALLAAVQAAWAWRKFRSDSQFLANVDPLEGWISDPSAFRNRTV